MKHPKCTWVEDVSFEDVRATNTKYFVIIRTENVTILDLENLQKYQIDTRPHCELPEFSTHVNVIIDKNGSGILLVYNGEHIFHFDILSGKLQNSYEINVDFEVCDFKMSDGFICLYPESISESTFSYVCSAYGEGGEVLEGSWRLGKKGTMIKKNEYKLFGDTTRVVRNEIKKLVPPLYIGKVSTVFTLDKRQKLHAIHFKYRIHANSDYFTVHCSGFMLVFKVDNNATFVGSVTTKDYEFVSLCGSYLVCVKEDMKTLDIIALKHL